MNIDFIKLYQVSLRAFFSLVFLFAITKLIGKKESSEFNLFDYMISISIGNFAAEISLNTDYQFVNGIAALLVFAFVYILISKISLKSIRLRKYVTGTPTILIDNGKFVYNSFKKLRLDINDFLQICRLSGYFDVSVLKYAMMEANGKISFMTHEKYSNVVYKDTNFKSSKQELKIEVIIDGRIIENNLKALNKDVKWLLEKTKKYDINNILLATLDKDDKLTIFNK